MENLEPLPIFPEQHYLLARELVTAAAEEYPPCQQHPEMWWSKAGNAAESERAREICNTLCTMTKLCLRFAIETGETEGIWGGTTPGQRHRLTKLHSTEQPPHDHHSLRDEQADPDLPGWGSASGVQEASA